MKRPTLLSLLALGAIALPSAAPSQTLHTSLKTESVDETYFHFSDLINSFQLNPLLFGTPISYLALGVGVVESLQGGCAQFDHWLVDLAANSFSLRLEAEALSRVMQGAAGAAAEFGANGFEHDGILQQLIPQITPCDMKPIMRLARMGGSIDAYAAHVGTAPYPKKTRRASFRLLRDIVIENDSSSAIELPVRITGEVFAARAWGWDPKKTFATADLTVSGTVAGQAFNDNAHTLAQTAIPETDSIDLVRRITVAPGRGRFVIHVDINAEAETVVQAKSAGIGGSLADSATAGVDFPDIEIGNFTGPNGTDLPPGVRIYDQSDGSSYADTRPWPGAPNLVFGYKLSRDTATNEIICTVALTNTGDGEAQDVRITGVILRNVVPPKQLPAVIGRLVPERPANRADRTFRFPASTGPKGAQTLLRLNGTRVGGTFGSSFRVVLP